MKQSMYALSVLSALVFTLAPVHTRAQQANDQFGFGDKAFMIQLASEAGKSANGFWDIPGSPGNNGNLNKGPVKNWLNMEIWQREKTDAADRLFSFTAAQGSAAGKYFINFAREKSWGINAIEGSKKVEARTAADPLVFKHLGKDKWKILTQSGMVFCLETNSSKNGTKIVLKPDHDGPDTEWVFYDAATLKSFIPAPQKKAEPESQLSLKLAVENKSIQEDYFSKVSLEKFTAENANGVLKSAVESVEMPDQWNTFLNIVKGARLNKTAKKQILKALSEAAAKPAKGFADNLLKGPLKQSIQKEAAAEKDAEAKNYINLIADKF